MVDFGQAIRDYVRFGYCSSLGNIATFGEIFGGGGSGIGEFGINAARFLHNQFCNAPPPVDPDPPFAGGQCPVLYNVNCIMTRVSGSTQNPFSVSGQAYGPIRGATFRNIGSNVTQLIVLGSPNGSNTTGEYGIGSVATNFGSPDTNVNGFTVASVSRADSAPDTCGNPDPVIPPYTPGDNTVNNNVTYVDNEGNNVTIPVVIAFGYAKIDANANINIPFTLNLDVTPTANITGNLNLNTGDVTYNANNPSLPTSDCNPNSDAFEPDPNLPSNPVDVPDEEPDPTPDPDKPQYRKLLKAVIVTVGETSPQSSTVFQETNPDVFVPDLGLVSFQISVSGRSGWTEDIRVKNKRQFIPCPWYGGATAVRGTPRPGSTFTLTPVYVKTTVGETFPE